jgi:hypothetical protein
MFWCLPEVFEIKNQNTAAVQVFSVTPILKLDTAALLSIVCHHPSIFWYFLLSLFIYLFIYSTFHFFLSFSLPLYTPFI